MTDETVKTLVWAVVFLFAIQSFTSYAIVRLFITGKGIFERRDARDVRRVEVLER